MVKSNAVQIIGTPGWILSEVVQGRSVRVMYNEDALKALSNLLIARYRSGDISIQPAGDGIVLLSPIENFVPF